MTTPFANKAAAAEAAAKRPLAGPIFVSGISASIEGVKAGWYVGFPKNIDGKLYGSEWADPCT